MLKYIGKIVTSAVVFGLAVCSVGMTVAKANVPESKDPIKIVMMGYSGDNIIMFIYGGLIKKLGYNVEYTPADYIGQFTGVAAGDLHIASPRLGYHRQSSPGRSIFVRKCSQHGEYWHSSKRRLVVSTVRKRRLPGTT